MSEILILLHPSHTEQHSAELVRNLHRGQRYSVRTDIVSTTSTALYWVIDHVWTDADIAQMLSKIRDTEFFPIFVEFHREVSAELTVAMIALDAFIRDRFLSIASRSDVTRIAAAVEESSLVAGSDHQSLAILLADDHESNRKLIKRQLEDMGHQCVVVENGELAVTAVQDRHFDLVLMDCQMPVLDGIDATRQIRALAGKFSHLPILAVTANHSPGLRQLCHSVGMNAFLSKPVDAGMLRRCIHELTRKNALAAGVEFNSAEKVDADIDASHLNQVRELDGTGDFMVEMIEAFLVKLDPLVRDLEQKIAAVDLSATERAAHFLKSSAGNVGARAIWRSLNQIEELARAGNAAGMQQELRLLLPLVRSTREEFSKLWLSDLPGAA